MKFTRELPSNVNVIRGYSSSELRIGQRSVSASCLLSANSLIVDWRPRTAVEVTLDDFAAAFDWHPEIILLGTGRVQNFPSRDLYAQILSRSIGFEVMDTGAACRMFNILVNEERRVAAGLILEAE
jgi:uncharacterized protein